MPILGLSSHCPDFTASLEHGQWFVSWTNVLGINLGDRFLPSMQALFHFCIQNYALNQKSAFLYGYSLP